MVGNVTRWRNAIQLCWAKVGWYSQSIQQFKVVAVCSLPLTVCFENRFADLSSGSAFLYASVFAVYPLLVDAPAGPALLGVQFEGPYAAVLPLDSERTPIESQDTVRVLPGKGLV
jgi:hypothetical protein